MFDRSLLSDAALEFAVLADTHYFPDPGGRPVEFASRLRQSARAEVAIQLAAALRTPFVVHLGDLGQAVPEGDDHAATREAALAQLARHGLAPRHVAGNQDIGDKPDPTMPTGPVTAATLAAYHQRVGPSWYAWSMGGWRFLVLNSQILNGPLPAAEEQRRWFEEELVANRERLVVFLHLPLFLRASDDPDLGHYDTLGEPARAWLLDLVARHGVELVLSGHSHWSFFNRLAAARLVVCPSTSHTRPGFSELFSAAPPPEQGRDDTAKLGLTLVRLGAGPPRLHPIRTHGATSLTTDAGQLVLTRQSADLPASRLGLTLTHPLAQQVELPLAWPSVVRQPVRNDYPFLAVTELGAGHVRFPASDLADATQRERLVYLREEGVRLAAWWLWQPGLDLVAAVQAFRPLLDGVELLLPGAVEPSAEALAQVVRVQSDLDLPVALGPVLPGQPVPGKQLRRTRIGYASGEVAALDHALAVAGVRVDRALMRLDASAAAVAQVEDVVADRIGAFDWLLDVGTLDEGQQVERLAAAHMAVSGRALHRLVVEPLVDLDRTMDAALGLLDRLCNPRPAATAVRVLGSVLFAWDEAWDRLAAPAGSGWSIGLRGESVTVWLWQPSHAGSATTPAELPGLAGTTSLRLYDLGAGRSRSVERDAPLMPASVALLVGRRPRGA